jgi:GT2 family glycosyltransferase
MSDVLRFPSVAIVIVNWNGFADTVECLESLRELAYPDYSVIVVDNASSDDSEAKLRALYPQHTVIQSGSNRGLAGGSNAGIRHALDSGADYVLMLNNDTRVEPSLLDTMVRTSEKDPRIGLTGGRVEYVSPPGRVWACGGTFDVDTGHARHFMSEQEFHAFVPFRGWCAYIPACLLLIRRQCLEDIGLFSERFFHLVEDVDFCIRANRGGWKLALAPGARVLHKGSASMARFSPLYNYYEQRNRLFVIRQYRMTGKSVCGSVKDAFMILTRLTWTLTTIDRFRHIAQGAWFLLLAVYDFARGRDGKRENDFGDHTVPAVSQRRACRRESDL